MLQRHDIINSLFNKYNLINPRYLEIGVWNGSTFNNVNTIYKDGVDPGQYGNFSCVNYKCTSDIFFKDFIKHKYDFIFIDGLHTAYQVSKDIYNSIENINNKGIIMIDDIYPHNKNEQEPLNLYKSGPQSGDVWKAVYNILDTIEDISDEIIFYKNSERGNLIFKLKNNNSKNITIDSSIPTNNIDGWNVNEKSEWNKYSYDIHFNDYLNRINKYIIE
jgi:hypothetical protein